MVWYLPILIFLARVCDVSIGTLRIITVIRGHKLVATFLGFIEVSIWIFAVSAVIVNITESLWTVVGYASGYATGTLLGMLIEEKLALGSQMVRVVNTDATRNVSTFLRGHGFVVTRVEGSGANGPRELSFLVVPRKKTQSVLRLLYEYAPNVFITIEDLRSTTMEGRLFREPRSQLTGWRRLTKYK
jgi:uncharacterized protein YebE (UPF0316 family)